MCQIFPEDFLCGEAEDGPMLSQADTIEEQTNRESYRQCRKVCFAGREHTWALARSNKGDHPAHDSSELCVQSEAAGQSD
jgi:hypothetical protein